LKVSLKRMLRGLFKACFQAKHLAHFEGDDSLAGAELMVILYSGDSNSSIDEHYLKC
jgi:hypothetical protein